MAHVYGVSEEEVMGWTLARFRQYRDFAVDLVTKGKGLSGAQG